MGLLASYYVSNGPISNILSFMYIIVIVFYRPCMFSTLAETCLFWPIKQYFSRKKSILTETRLFRQKQYSFGRNNTLSAETTLFRQNIRIRPNFGFSKWSVSVFGVSVKNLFRSDTNRLHESRYVLCLRPWYS